jgi:hypothetical protein
MEKGIIGGTAAPDAEVSVVRRDLSATARFNVWRNL